MINLLTFANLLESKWVSLHLVLCGPMLRVRWVAEFIGLKNTYIYLQSSFDYYFPELLFFMGSSEDLGMSTLE